MTIQIAQRIGRALGVTSATKTRELDEGLRAYVRSVGPGATLPVTGSVPYSNLTGVPATFTPSNHLVQGNWTPADASGAGLVLTVDSATYVQHEDLIIARSRLTYPATADASAIIIGGLPFALTAIEASRQGFVSWCNAAVSLYCLPTSATSQVRLYVNPGAAAATNAQMSTRTIWFQVMYSK